MSKEYFKQPSKKAFMKVELPFILFLVPAFLIFLEIIGYIWELLKEIEFPSFFEGSFAKYFLILIILYILFLIGLRNLYKKMQENPFLVITEQSLYVDREMLPPLQHLWEGRKFKLNWSIIKRIEVKKEMFIVHYEKNGKTKSQKVELKWVENTEDLLETLKMKCQQERITWTE
ncbi:MAG: hypothetical protein PVF58_20965 [Candidatus Methanofastidiosia archaeon]|jgi:hypothetical protein